MQVPPQQQQQQQQPFGMQQQPMGGGYGGPMPMRPPQPTPYMAPPPPTGGGMGGSFAGATSGPPPMGGGGPQVFNPGSAGGFAAPPTGPPQMGGGGAAFGAPPMGGGMMGAPPMAGGPGPMAMGGAPPMASASQPLPGGISQRVNYGASDSSGVGHAYTAQEMAPPPIDEFAQCDRRFMNLSFKYSPGSPQLQTPLPVGCMVRPLAPTRAADGPPVPVVNFGDAGVVRCKRCRAYINPFVQFTNNGRNWRCNICGNANDVPAAYYCHLDQQGNRRDRNDRPELLKGQVEIIAPAEYMVRAPQAPAFLFVIDVSHYAIQSGMVAAAAAAIKASLDALPGGEGGRTKIGFITFSSSVQFYNLKAGLSQPQMLNMADIEEPFLPMADELLVPLSDSREVVERLLDALPAMFAENSDIDTATGVALECAYKAMKHVGGKLCLFQHSLPSLGRGQLRNRDNQRLYDTPKESDLLLPAVDGDGFYARVAKDMSRVHIACDLFLFSPQYTDVATLSELPQRTAGQLFYYPGFSAARLGTKFHQELIHVLTRETGFEAVMRIRVTKGWKINNFYGNYLMRGTDLLALPNVTSDSAFFCDYQLDPTQGTPVSRVLTIQSALLYTTSTGERRIRVNTICSPMTNSLKELLEGVDIECCCAMMGKQALATALGTAGGPKDLTQQVQAASLRAAREELQRKCQDTLRSCQSANSATTAYGPTAALAGQRPRAQIPTSLQLLARNSMALFKSVAFRGGTSIRSDQRAYYMQRLLNMATDLATIFMYPRLFSLHNMTAGFGEPVAADALDTLDASYVVEGADVSWREREGAAILSNE